MIKLQCCVLFVLLAPFAFCEDAPPAHVKTEMPKPDKDGWITLFNGKDLTGWDGDPKVWRVENGYISGKAESVGGNTFLIYDHPFANFVLEADCIMVKGKGFDGNSGIQYRSKVMDAAKWVVGGYQADMGEGWWGTNYEERGRGVLWKPAGDAAKAAKPYDEWNHYVITANGIHLKQEINSVVTGEKDDTDEKKRSAEGIIALQYHAPGKDFEVRFKNLRIKVLPPTEPAVK